LSLSCLAFLSSPSPSCLAFRSSLSSTCLASRSSLSSTCLAFRSSLSLPQSRSFMEMGVGKAMGIAVGVALTICAEVDRATPNSAGIDAITKNQRIFKLFMAAS
jgi:hypothetical protein